MSPAQVLCRSKGLVIASTLSDSGRAETRMSPRVADPCAGPGTPSAAPSSPTRPTFRLAYCDHDWKARRNSPCQTAAGMVPRVAFSVEPTPETSVPSGTKLRVMLPASGQGVPNCAGVVRSSSC